MAGKPVKTKRKKPTQAQIRKARDKSGERSPFKSTAAKKRRKKIPV